MSTRPVLTDAAKPFHSGRVGLGSRQRGVGSPTLGSAGLPHSRPARGVVHPTAVLIGISPMTDVSECLFYVSLAIWERDCSCLFFWADSPPNRLTESLTLPRGRDRQSYCSWRGRPLTFTP